MFDFTLEDLDLLNDEEFEQVEKEVKRLVSCIGIANMRGSSAIYWDDQRIGEKRHEFMALKHPSVNVEAEMAFRRKAVVDSLEGNSLIHPLTTPVIVVDEDSKQSRSLFKSLGVEGLSKYRETPTAIISVGFVPGANIVEDNEWKRLWGAWLRLTKNEYHAGWVENMEPTNTRPPLTPAQDKAMLGKYAYQKDEKRKRVPEPPGEDTFKKYPDITDPSWQFENI